MNRRTIRLISLLLAFLMLLCACFSDPVEQSSAETSADLRDESADVSDEEVEESKEAEESSEEPVPDHAFNGATLKVLVGDESRKSDFSADSETESDLQSALAARLDKIRSVHGITFLVGVVAENDDVATELASYAESGIETDLVLYGASSFAKHIPSGLYYDLNGIDGFDTDFGFADRLSVCGKVYFVTGDACLSSFDSAYAVFYDKALAAGYLEDLYSLVLSGGWTVDKMHEFAKETSNGKMSFSSDDPVFGIVSRADDANAFMTSCGECVAFADQNGYPVINIGTPSNVTFFEKLKSILSDKSCSAIAENQGNWKMTHEREKEIFLEGRALFMPYTLSLANENAAFGQSVGILPMPKKDVSSAYVTPVDTYSLTVVGIPKTNTSNLYEACAALELLDYYGRHDVREAYNEKIKQNLNLGSDDLKMLSVIQNGLSFDIGGLYLDASSGDTSPTRVYPYSLTSEKAFEDIISELLPLYENAAEKIKK